MTDHARPLSCDPDAAAPSSLAGAEWDHNVAITSYGVNRWEIQQKHPTTGVTRRVAVVDEYVDAELFAAALRWASCIAYTGQPCDGDCEREGWAMSDPTRPMSFARPHPIDREGTIDEPAPTPARATLDDYDMLAAAAPAGDPLLAALTSQRIWLDEIEREMQSLRTERDGAIGALRRLVIEYTAGEISREALRFARYVLAAFDARGPR